MGHCGCSCCWSCWGSSLGAVAAPGAAAAEGPAGASSAGAEGAEADGSAPAVPCFAFCWRLASSARRYLRAACGVRMQHGTAHGIKGGQVQRLRGWRMCCCLKQLKQLETARGTFEHIHFRLTGKQRPCGTGLPPKPPARPPPCTPAQHAPPSPTSACPATC